MIAFYCTARREAGAAELLPDLEPMSVGWVHWWICSPLLFRKPECLLETVYVHLLRSKKIEID